MFQTKVVERIKTHFVFSNFFSRKFVSFMRQDTHENITRPMRVARWITQASDIQNMQYLLLFHGKSGYANAPRCCVYTYIVFSFPPCVLKGFTYRVEVVIRIILTKIMTQPVLLFSPVTLTCSQKGSNILGTDFLSASVIDQV